MSWSFDISRAPRGYWMSIPTGRADKLGEPIISERFMPAHVILATKCRKVLKSHWLPDEERWVMLAKGEEPVAWTAWPEYPATKDTPHTTTVAP